MLNRPHPSARNDSLRLTLSQHEQDYIREGLQKTARVVKVWLVIFLVCGALAAIPWIFSRFQLSFISPIVLGLFAYLAPIVSFVAFLKLILAAADFLKFYKFKNDHEKFLKYYRQRT